MPVDHVLDSGQGKVQTNKKPTQSSIRLTEIFQNERMGIQIPMHL